MNLRPFLRAAAICSLLSAVTTLLLIYLPGFVPRAPTFEAQLQLSGNVIHLSRLMVGVVHPLLVLTAAIGVAALTLRQAPGRTVMGIVGFTLWAFTEALQQSLVLIALNIGWRRSYLAAQDPLALAHLRAQIEGFPAVSEAFFFLLLVAFVLGNVLLGLAVVPSTTWRLAVRGAYAAGAVLGMLSFIASFVTPGLDATFAWVYPAVQPCARALVGVWLWRAATRTVEP